MVNKYIDQEIAELVPGVLFIDEVPSNILYRYVMQLMTPANILARMNGKEPIDKEEIDEVRDLFLDAKYIK